MHLDFEEGLTLSVFVLRENVYFSPSSVDSSTLTLFTVGQRLFRLFPFLLDLHTDSKWFNLSQPQQVA